MINHNTAKCPRVICFTEYRKFRIRNTVPPQDGILFTATPHKTNKRHRGNNANPLVPLQTVIPGNRFLIAQFLSIELWKKKIQIVDRSSVLLSILHSFYVWHFDIFNYQMLISPPLGLHFESNSHPWGKLIGTHNSLYCITERLQT